MQTKLDLKLETGNQWKFAIAKKFFTLSKVGEVVDNIPWINLFIVLEGDKINFFLDMYPIGKSRLYFSESPIPIITASNVDIVVNSILFQQELILLPNGFPWYYADRKNQFRNLSVYAICIIFWAGPYVININRTYQFFDNIIEMLKRQGDKILLSLGVSGGFFIGKERTFILSFLFTIYYSLP